MATHTIELPSAVPLLLTPKAGGRALSTATGFLARREKEVVLVTCRHVVTGRDQKTNKVLSSTAATPDCIDIRHHASSNGQSVDQLLTLTEELYTKGGRPRWREHSQHGPNADIAVLPVSPQKAYIVECTLGVGDPPITVKPAEPVSVVGYPFGHSGPGQFAIWATGFIASELAFPYDGLPVFLIDCRSRPGQSGSPVYAHRTAGAVFDNGSVSLGTGQSYSRFLGVYSGRIHPDADIGLVWTAQAVLDAVRNGTAGKVVGSA